MTSLTDALDEVLPQTQCTRCGYPDCRSYAAAIAEHLADINRCPPGGADGIARLAAVSGRPALALDPTCGIEGPRHLAVIDEATCIGCTRCLPACPVDCIVGGPKSMHTVIERLCTGCELCVSVCPVDCIALVPVSGGRTGWQAWSPALATQARARHAAHRERLAHADREQSERWASAGLDHGVQPTERPPTPLPATVEHCAPAQDGRPLESSPVARAAVVEEALRRARDARRSRR